MLQNIIFGNCYSIFSNKLLVFSNKCNILDWNGYLILVTKSFRTLKGHEDRDDPAVYPATVIIVSTWMGDHLGTQGVEDFFAFFCIYLRQFVTRGLEEWNVSAGLSKRPSKYSLIHFYKRCVSWDYVESNTGSPFFTGAKKLHYRRPNNHLIKSIIFIFFLRIFFLHFCQNS